MTPEERAFVRGETLHQPRAVRLSGASDPSVNGVYYRRRRAACTAGVAAYGLGCLLIGVSAEPIAAHWPGTLAFYAVAAGAFVMGCGVLVARSLLR